MPETTETHVELRHVDKRFGTFYASRDISLSIPRGRLAALLGPSGSGKTTILRMIAGLETPDQGDIVLDGRVVNHVPASDRGIGFVFQSYALFRYMTVYDNIAFGLRVKKTPRDQVDARVRELLTLIDCEGLEKRYPSQLSGGQRQRVAFARALAPSPRLLLLDEPFAAIDAKVRLELRTWLRNMINHLGITSIFVTHDQDEAIEVADQIIVTNHGQVEQAGTPQELYRVPATPFVARFIGHSTQIRHYARFRSFQQAGPDSVAILRPEFIRIFRKGERQQYQTSADEGVVEDIIFRGSNVEVRVRIHGELLSAVRSVADPPVEIGEQVDVFLYRMFIVDGETISLQENAALKAESVVI